MSKAITERPNQGPQPGGGQPPAETAPSFVREDEPRVARLAGMAGVMLAVLGGMALGMILANRPSGLVGPSLGSTCLLTGLVLMLLHAAVDRDLQIRRTYLVFALLLLTAGVVLCLVPAEGQVGRLFVAGYPCLLVAWLFLTSAVRNETDEAWRRPVVGVLGVVGAVLALTGFIGGNIGHGNFLTPHGLLLALLGLGYLCSFVGTRGVSDDLAYWIGVGMGAVGVLFFLIALGRSILPPILYARHWINTRPEPYVVPVGILLMGLGLAYAAVSAGLCSENRLVVMTRRELAAFFYSPVAYIVLLGFTVIGGLQFLWFVGMVTDWQRAGLRAPLVEPVVREFFMNDICLFAMAFIVPALTMRLLSEEQRTGTMEVLLTAPVDETAVVLSKFFAAWLFFLLLWVPWGLFLLALRVMGGQPLDYRPLLSFLIALGCTGAGFIAMGLFFSSITRNQIVSAVLTFVGMLVLTAVVLGPRLIGNPDSPWVSVMNHASYINLWAESLDGKLEFKFPVFHLSAAALWLFLTVKVLDARKWS